MSREWKPGNVAMIGGHVALRVANKGDDYFIDSTGLHWRFEDDNAQSLVVIDLEAYNNDLGYDTPTLLKMLCDSKMHAMDFRRWLADQIEAQTKPPKPEEPKGLGAVVEDCRGVRWVRTESARGITNPWQATMHEAEPDKIRYLGWSAVDAVEVLSEGVPA